LAASIELIEGPPKLKEDFLRQVFSQVRVSAVGVADLVQNFLVLPYQVLKGFLEVRGGHALFILRGIANGALSFVLLFAPRAEKSHQDDGADPQISDDFTYFCSLHSYTLQLTMGEFTNSKTVSGFSVKLWRGERMALIGMDVDDPEPDFVGFSIEVQSPGSSTFQALRNRLAFSYPKTNALKAVNGYRNFLSTQAPFQKFRWIHFPYEPKGGDYTYRVTKQHMQTDGVLTLGLSITLDIALDPVVYDGFLDVGFTRNFASSQAYVDRYKNNPKVIPADPAAGLSFKKAEGDVYQWLGFEAYQLIMDFLTDVAGDETLELDFFGYDFNEPDILAILEKIGPRLRAVIDNSKGHQDGSAESEAADRLSASAGADRVVRMHFSGLQHNKVLIAKRNGEAQKVLLGSTNFSFRGLYIQANNALVFRSTEAAGLFEEVFELAFSDPKGFNAKPIAQQWRLVQEEGRPPVHFCFSPHKDSALSLSPLGAAIDQATSSVFFCIAFLNQAKTGALREAIDRLEGKSVFSYGISDKRGGLQVNKPDGSVGIVDFEYLAAHTPEPFKSEWDGGTGIHEHHKFVVTDFNLPTAKVFTGSSNMSVNGEEKNGDNLVMIEDPRVATSYAIEALRVFDHLQFRTKMKQAGSDKNAAELTLQKPNAISGKPAWFEKFYVEGSQVENDRKLFSH
jgi:phosphatidylserine/phosphatidylglycerophosphate/cardiolipin synthase-like enzyme